VSTTDHEADSRAENSGTNSKWVTMDNLSWNHDGRAGNKEGVVENQLTWTEKMELS